MMQPDLRTRAGCVHYVESSVLPQVIRAFGIRKELPPLGIVFATLVNGEPVSEPMAVPVNTPPVGNREIRRVMQRVAVSTKAIGSVYVRQDDFKLRSGGGKDVSAVIVQLEHKTFGDLLWTAYLKNGKLEPWLGPVDVQVGPVQVNALRFLAHRWMS